MGVLEPVVREILFDEGGTVLEESFVKKLSLEIDLEEETIRRSIQKLINKNKLFRFEDKYISLTDFGDIQEDKINELLRKLVYDKFLFKNPKLQNGKEFCDNMILFGETLIIFQSKTKDYTKIEEFDKFRRKCIDNAIKQLNDTINWTRNNAVIKKFKNNLGYDIEFKSENIKKIIGVCISYFHPDKDYFITKGNMANLKNKEEIANIITYQELIKIIEYNDTLPEFIEYLDQRRMLVKKNSPLLSERKILSYFFLTNRTMLPKDTTKDEWSKSDLVMLTDDFEESLENGELKSQLKKRTETNKDSYFIDQIINKILPQASTKEDSLLTELIKLNRFQRHLIAKQVLPAYEHFMKGKSDFRAPFISIDNKINIIFLFSRKFQDSKENERMLMVHTAIMKKKHNLDKIIGISENHYSNGMINHNFCMMKGEIEFDEPHLPEPIKQILKDTSKMEELRNIHEFD